MSCYPEHPFLLGNAAGALKSAFEALLAHLTACLSHPSEIPLKSLKKSSRQVAALGAWQAPGVRVLLVLLGMDLALGVLLIKLIPKRGTEGALRGDLWEGAAGQMWSFENSSPVQKDAGNSCCCCGVWGVQELQ